MQCSARRSTCGKFESSKLLLGTEKMSAQVEDSAAGFSGSNKSDPPT